jgi:hypothetical protein
MKKFIVLTLVCQLLFGCVSTKQKPNISAIYRIPELAYQLAPLENKSIDFEKNPVPTTAKILFQKLYQIDPIIASEVGRIPEFEGIIGEPQILALNRFVTLIQNSKPEEKANISKLLQVGKPGIRRYCTPIEAIFWLLERQKYEYQKVSMQPLESLLSESWNFSENGRWNNFKVVTDRLNAPELIHFYSKYNFSYVRQGQRQINAEYIFFSKNGCCQDYTAFDVHCLQNAGYDAKAIIVKSPTGHPIGHVICEFKGKDGKAYVLDDSCTSCTGGKGIEEKESYVKRLPQIGTGYTR